MLSSVRTFCLFKACRTEHCFPTPFYYSPWIYMHKQTFAWLNDAVISFWMLCSGLRSTVIAPLSPALWAVWIPPSTWWDDLLQYFRPCCFSNTNRGTYTWKWVVQFCEINWKSLMILLASSFLQSNDRIACTIDHLYVLVTPICTKLGL